MVNGLKPARRAAGRTAVCEAETRHSSRTTRPSRMMPAVGATEEALLSLARVVEQRDNHTAGHCERLAFTGVTLGVEMRLESKHLLSLYLGGYLHDVGKVGLPDSILFKSDHLTKDEWDMMRTHPERGEEICRPLRSLAHVLPIIRHHHERLDGSGYPDRLSGADIPLLARVLQVVDIYDALTNTRPYKEAYSRAKALDILEEEADRGWRDREITALFVRMHKRMHGKIADYKPSDAPASMGKSLSNLQSFLAQ